MSKVLKYVQCLYHETENRELVVPNDSINDKLEEYFKLFKE